MANPKEQQPAAFRLHLTTVIFLLLTPTDVAMGLTSANQFNEAAAMMTAARR